MTKVAVLISGEPRVGKSFTKFINQITNYSLVDWFFWFWQSNLDPYSVSRIPPSWVHIDPVWAQQRIQSHLPANHCIRGLGLGDRAAVVLPQTSFKPGETSIERMWGMYYSLFQADLLRQLQEKQTGPYDLVIRARPDITLEAPVDCLQTVEHLASQPGLCVITPASLVFGYQGETINDMFAMGNSESVSCYCNTVNHIPHYMGQVLFHPETMLAYHLRVQGVKVLKSGTINLRPDSCFGTWA